MRRGDPKTTWDSHHFFDVDRQNVLHVPLFEPHPIVDKHLERQRVALIEPTPTGCYAVIGDRRTRLGCGQARRVECRLEVHALRHVAMPTRHWLADYSRFHASTAQMGGDRKTIGSGADDCDIGRLRA
jgi:hypothetical protein